MKKLVIILALMLIQTQVLAAETSNTNVDKKPAGQVQATQQQVQANQQKPQAKKQDEEYLLKYNIRDLEAAPWLHGGKRSYN